MRLEWFELLDFRNHARSAIEALPDGLIVVVGPNGEGKTNLIEGLDFLYALRSPRASTNEPLVREGAEAAYTRGEFITRDGRVLVEVEIPRRGASRVKVNRSVVRRRRDLRKQVRAVLFGPFDLPIVIGEPGKRRDFMDEAVVALHPPHDSLGPAFDRVLRQRNRLLKEWEGRGTPRGIEAWDEELVRAGAALSKARGDAVGRFAGPAGEAFENLTGSGLHVEYAPNVSADTDGLEERFAARIAERRADELLRRTTLVGPHRDDLELAVRDMGARAFGSHGETWAAALCLRLGLADAVAVVLGESPVLLVDDPFSALDPHRRQQAGEDLAGRGGQVIISVADEADVPAAAGAVWDVRGGTVKPRGS